MIGARGVRVRMILGEYEQPEPYGLDVFLAPVSFPMEVEPLDEDWIPEGNGEWRTLRTEEELREWAEKRFAAYGIWSMPVPDDAIDHEEYEEHEQYEEDDEDDLNGDDLE